ncbi:MAG: O-antigen ligase family protein, partial [Solirubrobacteraceae bacterium]
RSAAVAVVLAAAGVVIAVAASGRLHISSANEATSGRASLVQQGANLFAARPLQGYGAGAFSCEYLRRSGDSCAHPPAGVTSDSHTIPVTVAAEQGVIGLIAYVCLLVAALWRLASRGVRRSVVRVAVLAAFVALVIHTWAYADFLEDPITWTLLAVGSALAAE